MIKVGICGAGTMGQMHAACYDWLPKARIVAVSDVRRASARNLAKPHDAKVFLDSKEMISQADVDMVDICLPTNLHVDNILAATQRGVACLCEKPITRTVAEGRRVIRAVEQSNISFMVAQVMRFWPEYTVLKKTVDKRSFGELKILSMQRLSPWPPQVWANKPNQCGGAALDLHIHDTDFIRHILGEPDSVRSVGVTGKTGCHYISTQYRYRGRTVCAEGGWNLPKTFPFQMGFRAVFERGTLVYHSLNTPLTLYRDKRRGSLLKLPEVNVKTRRVAGADINILRGYLDEIGYFVDCLDRGRKPTMVLARDACNSVALVLKEIAAVS